MNPPKSSKLPKAKTAQKHSLTQGQRVLVIGGPRKGQSGNIRYITDCMYELSIDNGDVGHVWKENVRAEETEPGTEYDAELHYKLGKAINKLKAATAEVDELYKLIGTSAASQHKTTLPFYFKKG
jgi:hypothetical protein